LMMKIYTSDFEVIVSNLYGSRQSRDFIYERYQLSDKRGGFQFIWIPTESGLVTKYLGNSLPGAFPIYMDPDRVGTHTQRSKFTLPRVVSNLYGSRQSRDDFPG